MKKNNLYQPIVIENPSTEKQGKKTLFLMEVNNREYCICEEESWNRWASEKPGRYGRGGANTKSDPRLVERTGLLGEMAFGKLFNLPVDLEYKKGGDKYDFLIFNRFKNEYLKCDIKCAVKKNYIPWKGYIKQRNSMYEQPLVLTQDIYVFGYVKTENRKENESQIILTGCLLKDDLSTPKKRKHFGIQIRKSPLEDCEHFNYEIPYENLRQMTILYKDFNQLPNAVPETTSRHL